jgi:gas vesicle structural protein
MADHLEPADEQRLVLGDLLNRVLDKGLLVRGNMILSVADIDLVQLDLTLMLSAVQTVLDRAVPATGGSADAGR